MNKMKIEMDSKFENEVFARCAGVAFLMPYNPTVDEIMEIKTILAEAITNSIIHGYNQESNHTIALSMEIDDENVLKIQVEDWGVGIEDTAQARVPMYTTRADLERSGMGLTIMESFSDAFTIDSKVNEGCRIECIKKLHHEG